MDALQNEVIIKEFNQKKIKLTNYRVRFYSSRNTYTSIMLDKISVINILYFEKKKYLHFAIISAFGVFLSFQFNLPFQFPLGLSILFYLAYIFHKEKVIYINSEDSKSVNFSVSGLSADVIDEFIQETEKKSLELKRMLIK
ncbi:hypothetical protein [Psychroflexus salis]|uniref:Uncharacterized protein n=1 Tax=Psychroflexus salis TaxID=1526574 RepID=A0A916ZQQ4_9FLAO|nr:hypothetical protein [Psychroflexus salis]GGE06807.1 hypothetical protein GCM10010831_05380 [Psychroflexus salis]